MRRDLTTLLASCEETEKKLEQEFAKLTLGKEDAAIVDNKSESYKPEVQKSEGAVENTADKPEDISSPVNLTSKDRTENDDIEGSISDENSKIICEQNLDSHVNKVDDID